MSVVGWVLACVLIAVSGLAYLLLQAREIWRKTRLLLAELEAAGTRAEEASRPPATPGPPRGP